MGGSVAGITGAVDVAVGCHGWSSCDVPGGRAPEAR
jgi:hypothetical protein